MDNNSWRAAQAQVQIPVGGGGDWRTQFQADSRLRIVNKIMVTLKRHLPFSGQEGLQELKKIAVRFEEKIYAGATSQSDYLRKTSLKLLSVGTESQNPGVYCPQSNSPCSENRVCRAAQAQEQRQVHVLVKGMGSEAAAEGGDCRNQLPADSRCRIINKSEGGSRGQKRKCTDASAAASEKAKGKPVDPDTEVPSDVIDELTLGNWSFTDEDAMKDIGRIWPSVERLILAQSLGGKRLVGRAYLHNAAGSVYMDAALKQYTELEAQLAKLEAELLMHSTAQISAEQSRDAIKNDYLDLKKRYEAEVTKVKEEINAVCLELEQEKAAKLEMAEKLKKKDASLVLEIETSTRLGKELESAKLELIELRASLDAANMV